VVKNLIFCFDERNIEKFLEKNSLGKNAHVICKNNKIKKRFLESKINAKIINDYEISEEQIRKPLEWIKTWPNEILIDNKNFKELFVYDKISIFWYLENRLYHKRIHKLFTMIVQMKQIISEENPTKIWILGDYELNYIASNLHDNVSWVKDSTNEEEKSNISDKNYSGFLTWKLLLLKIFRGGILTKKSVRKGKSILFLSEIGSWRKVFDYDSKEYQYQDVFFHRIVKKCKEEDEDIEIIDFENNPKRLLASRTLNKQRSSTFEVPVTPWEKFLSYRTIMKSRKSYNEVKKTWNLLKNSSSFSESLVFENIPVYELLKKDFEELFNSFKTLAAIAMIEIANEIVDIKRPSVIVMHDEYGALQISFIHAAKKFEIPTLSLQHGTIYQNVFAYYHNLEDIHNKKIELRFPLPDKMFVWSDNAKKALITSAKFPESVPIVTGDPKMDFLEKSIKDFDHSEIINKNKIPQDKKIILFATENLPNQEERELIADEIFRALSELKEFFLVIKMHPNEYNVTIYQNAAKKYDFTSYVIFNEMDLYELLYICNVVIISYSTVGLEAMRMGKPVISLNLLSLHDNSIMKKGIFYEVRKSDELSSMILQTINNKNQEKISMSKIFAESDLGIIDGQATNRIVEYISKYTKKSS